MAPVVPAYIEEQINKHLTLAANLRAQRNSYFPVFRLAPEILANIFTHGARDHHESNLSSSLRVPDWVNVSYVCRRWRNVALDCPTLWAYHFIVSLRWTEELLARSKQASLNIHVYCDSLRARSWWSDHLERLLRHAERIQEFRLRVPAIVLPSKLPLCCPRLQVLDISVVWSTPSEVVDEWTSVIIDEDTPSLHTLHLTDCPLPWHSLNLSRLTTLFLCRVPAQSQQNIVGFLATLGRMQSLTVLHLERALPSAGGFLSGGAFGFSSKIDIPRLTRLFVVSPLSTAVVLLSLVNIPSKAIVRVEFEQEDGSSIDDYTEFPSVLARKFGQSEDLSSFSRLLVVRFPTYYEPTFTFSLSARGDCDPRLSMERPPRDSSDCLVTLVGIGQSRMVGRLDAIISDMCCSIPSTCLQSLHVVHPPSDLDFWERTLGHLRGLKELKLSHGFMPKLVPLLELAAKEPTTAPSRRTVDCAPTPGHTYIPLLEELVLYRIRFTSEDDLSEYVASQKSLLSAFSSRKEPHPRLTMIKCGYVPGDYLDLDLDLELELGIEVDDDIINPYETDSESSSDEYY